MSATTDGYFTLAVGVVLGLIIGVGPADCSGNRRACEGYAAGSGKDCKVSDGDCYCAVDGGLESVKLGGGGS